MINMNYKYLCVMRIRMNNSHSERSLRLPYSFRLFKENVLTSGIHRKYAGSRAYQEYEENFG